MDGENNIEITLFSSLRNLLGPHHLQEGEVYKVSLGCFLRKRLFGKLGVILFGMMRIVLWSLVYKANSFI